MTVSALAVSGLLGGALVRQLFVLSGVIRSCRFSAAGIPPASAQATPGPMFFVVVPVLREAGIIADAAAHLTALARGHAAQLVVITTAREAVEAFQHDSEDTVKVVEQLAAEHRLIHLHYADPDGLKGDQLNFAAAQCASLLPPGVSASEAFLTCYDADSRPPNDSLDQFTRAIAASPEASVFHQSSRFEVRTRPPVRGVLSWLAWAVGEGGALRANRFVAGFEIPRLRNRSAAAGPLKRWLCSYVYAHVTTHGLCIRLSLLLDLPFPACSPLEDMHYSFYLGSRNVPMVAVPSLDQAEVPDTPARQVEQASRWFFGPARAGRYLHDPSTQPGWRARLQTASAWGSALEWLGCAVVPPATVGLLVLGPAVLRIAAGVLTAVYLLQLVAIDRVFGAPASAGRRLLRLLACPVATILFGVGGFVGAVRLLRGGSGVGKTERRQAA
jgi:hypothetical protein